MTINEAYRTGVDILESNAVTDAEFDARCLLEFALGIDSTRFFVSRSDLIDDADFQAYSKLLCRRISGEPLQYILGKWEFMSNEFYVGKGVLIPRPETEKLVELAKEYITDIERPVVIDLCSGSGCIAISIAKLLPDATVYAVEKFDEAFDYLKKNIALNTADNVIAVKGDIFDKGILKDVSADLIVSNPPYIRKADIVTLSEEVKQEPVTALVGGEDGYDYYRFLSSYWLNEFLGNNGAMMVECAEDQGDYISELFSDYADKTEIFYDFNGLQRIVTAYK